MLGRVQAILAIVTMFVVFTALALVAAPAQKAAGIYINPLDSWNALISGESCAPDSQYCSRSLVVASDGTVYNIIEGNASGGEVRKFDSNGTYLGTFVSAATGYYDLAIDTQDNIYILVSGNIVRKYNAAAQLLQTFDIAAANAGFSIVPERIAVGGNGDVYVNMYKWPNGNSSATAKYIQRFNSAGTFQNEFVYYNGNVAFPGPVVDSSGNVYMYATTGGVAVYNTTGNLLRTNETIYSGATCSGQIGDLELDVNDELYVVTTNNCVGKYDTSGSLLWSEQTEPLGGPYAANKFLTIDSNDGTLLITDYYSALITRYETSDTGFTPTPTPTDSPTPTSTPTSTPTPTPTASPTATPTATLTSTPTVITTSTPTSTSTITQTPTSTSTQAPTETTPPTLTVTDLPISNSPLPSVTEPTIIQNTSTPRATPQAIQQTQTCPTIVSFTTSKAIAEEGEKVTLVWKTVSATSVKIGEAAHGPNGSIEYTIDRFRTVRLTALTSNCSATSVIDFSNPVSAELRTVATVGAGALVAELVLQQIATFGAVKMGASPAILTANLWGLALSIVQRNKKKRSWGVVYDSKSKQPLGRAVVRLFDIETGKVVDTVVSDSLGVFQLRTEAGRYLLKVVRAGYAFPSAVVSGNTDGGYSNIYHGEVIDKSSTESNVTVSIPLDPLEDKPLRRSQQLFESTIDALGTVSTMLLFAGLAYSLYAAMLFPLPINLAAVALYLLVCIGKLMVTLKAPKMFGKITDVAGHPISGLELGLFDKEFGTLLYRTFTSKKGEYNFATPNKMYVLKVMDARYIFVDQKTNSGVELAMSGKSDEVKLITEDLMVKRVRHSE